jgi:hypothetical protein
MLTRISGTLSGGSPFEEIPVQWRMFVEFKNVAQEGTKFESHGTFAGWADYIVIPARQAVASHIQLASHVPWSHSPGVYVLRLTGYSGEKPAPGAVAQAEINLVESFAAELDSCRADPQTRVAKKSVVLFFK